MSFKEKIYMAVQTTERTTCERKKLKKNLISFVKKIVQFILVRPATWHFIMVNLPAWIDKVSSLFKSIILFFSDFLS